MFKLSLPHDSCILLKKGKIFLLQILANLFMTVHYSRVKAVAWVTHFTLEKLGATSLGHMYLEFTAATFPGNELLAPG